MAEKKPVGKKPVPKKGEAQEKVEKSEYSGVE
jgi:hypothetical protein